jgi:hypothetical protein
LYPLSIEVQIVVQLIANQMKTDDLRALDYSKLQRFCRDGPDAPFDKLGLSALQWARCFEEGTNCHQKMIANIERLHAANQALASMSKLET